MGRFQSVALREDPEERRAPMFPRVLLNFIELAVTLGGREDSGHGRA